MGGWRNRGGETQGGLLSCTSTYANYSARLFAVFCEETTYTDPAPFQRAVRGRRGDDVHAERCPRVGRDPTLLRSVLGFHVVDFPFVLPNRETTRSRLERAVRVLAHQRGVLVQSSLARDPATALGRRPRPLGVRVTPSHPLRLAPRAQRLAAPVTFYIPTRPSCWRAAPPRDPTSRRLETHA